MQKFSLLVLSLCVLLGASDDCLINSWAPVTTNVLAKSLVSSYELPQTVDDLLAIAQLVLDAQIGGTEQQAALFFATTSTENKLIVRVRNCAVPDFGVANDVCVGRSDRIVEIYCPSVYMDENSHAFTSDFTPIGTSALLSPLVYGTGNEMQFWFAFGRSGNSGWSPSASGIPELNANSTADSVFVRAAVRSSNQPPVIAVTGAIRSSSEPCNPPVACVLGMWGDWSTCSVNCGGGSQHRTRSPVVQAQSGGTPCGNLGDTKQCNTQQCSQDLTGTARAGIVIACIGSVILAFLIFFSLAKNKRVFTNKSAKQRGAAKKAAAASRQPQPIQPQREHTSREKHASTDDEPESVAAPAKTVQVWV